MKTLLIVRHAKSSWDLLGQPDIERPLNERGKRDAPDMAKRLIEKDIRIKLFLSSPAKRARKTAKLFAEEYKVSKDEIRISDDLYEAGVKDFYNVISTIENEHTVVAIFSHNPGITDFVNTLVPGIRVDNMPTCSVFAVSFEQGSWEEFAEAKKKFLFFDYPKKSL